MQTITDEVVSRALITNPHPQRRAALGQLLHSIISAAVQRYISHLESQCLVELGTSHAPLPHAGEVVSGKTTRHRRAESAGAGSLVPSPR